MLASILASGLAAGAIYALVGVTYNTMFSTSRVMSFTAGQLAMLGGVFGSMFTLKLGMPIFVGFLLTLLGCALIGVITEFVAVRPVLKSLEQHLYVLSTLALALMIQQVTAIKWGTEPQPFPRLVGWGNGVLDEKFWLPVAACALTIAGLEYLYRRTLVGRAFLAIAEDNFAARALGLPERHLRVLSYALAGVIGGVAGFSGGELLLAFFALLAVALILPMVSNDYWALIGTRAAIYWVLVSGLNLVVGFAGHLAIGYVALLTLGAYTTSVLVAGNVMPPLPVFAALIVAGAVGAVFGVIVGLPALRLRTFYFAMSTLGFATIVTQIALAWQSVTGGGIGISGPEFPAPFNTAWGYYYLCLGFGAVCTWMSANVGHSRFGRALIALRDAEVAAEATGISKPRMLIAVFLLAGALAAVAGGLFASLQTYITPDAFTFDLSILFFIAILIGGRGSILGPMLGTIILTILPEVAAPLAAWSTFLYAVLLLVIVLAMPGGIAALLDFRNRRPLASNRAIVPCPATLDGIVRASAGGRTLRLRGIALSFDNVRAIDGLDLDVE